MVNTANTALLDGHHFQICFDAMGYLMQIALTPFGVVLLERKNDNSCGLNTVTLPYRYGNKYGAPRTCLEDSVFAAVFTRTTTFRILQLDTVHMHIFLVNFTFR